MHLSRMFGRLGRSARYSAHRKSVFAGLGVALALGTFAFNANFEASGSEGVCSGEPQPVGEVLEGTPCADTIVAPEGVKVVDGGGGNDTIVAGAGIELISGGSGSDLLVGNAGVDVINGGQGPDLIFGDSLPDNLPRAESVEEALAQGASISSATTCERDPGDADLGTVFMEGDFCRGGNGNQIIYGGEGADMIFGERGNDQIFGQTGDDRLYGSVGDDFVAGNDGDDLLAGGNGSDNVLGGPDNDLVRGDTIGDERQYSSDNPAGLNGGSGDYDTISFASAVVPGFVNSVDKANLSPYPGFPSSPDERGVYVDLAPPGSDGQTVQMAENGSNEDGGGIDALSGFENVVGSPFPDYIEGNDSANVIQGGGGQDVILGQGGSDKIYGGADSDHLDGGTGTAEDTVYGESGSVLPGAATDFTNWCVNAEKPTSRPDCVRSWGGAITRDTTKLSVGVVGVGQGTPARDFSEVYVSGSTASDNITTSFNSTTQVLTFNSGGVEFDPVQKQGCTYPTTTKAICDLSASGPLDEISYYGGASGDNLSAYGANLPVATSNFILGGTGSDQDLKGSDETEDVVIDGPDIANDVLYGFARSDAVYQGLGKDKIYGGADGDVLYASEICEGNIMDGGDANDEDNITWAALELPQRSMSKGVHASVDSDLVGRPPGSGPYEYSTAVSAYCLDYDGDGDTEDDLDRIPGVEHLEGSGGWDTLIGGDAGNTLLGRAGVDKLYGNGGDDKLRTNADDYDFKIDCGSGDDNLLRDINSDRSDGRDSVYSSCETVDEDRPEYNFAHDVKILGANPEPIAMFRLGERQGNRAYNAEGVGGGANNWLDSDGFYIGSPAQGEVGSVPMVEDRATKFDSTGDWIKLGDPWNSTTFKHVLDPANYSSTGFTVEIWIKLNSTAPPPASSSQFQYLMSKFLDDGSKGLFLRRNSSKKIVFGVKWGGVVTSAASDPVEAGSGWHQVVGTLKGTNLNLYVDQQNFSASNPAGVFPTTETDKSVKIGDGPYSSGFLPATVDSVAFYRTALASPCEVGRHYDVRTQETPRGCS